MPSTKQSSGAAFGTFLRTMKGAGSRRRAEKDISRQIVLLLRGGPLPASELIGKVGVDTGEVLRAIRDLDYASLVKTSEADEKLFELTEPGRDFADELTRGD